MMSGTRQLEIMVKRAKAVLDGAGPGIRWSDAVWNVARWLPKRASAAGGCLYFTLSSTRGNGWIPLPAPFSEFAKASVVLLWSRSRMGLRPLATVVRALRYLLCALERRKTVSPCDLRPDDFFDAFANYQRTGASDSTLGAIGRYLEFIAAGADRFELTPVPLAFKNPLPERGPRLSDVDPQVLTRRIAEEKLPHLDTLAAYAQCTNHPVSDDERILLRAIDLHIALGTRIGEALTMPIDCWVEESVKDLDGRMLQDPHTGEPQRRYGIRYYAEKGYDLAIDWLAEQDVPLARRAITELTALCAKARTVARWLEDHPGRLWDYPPEQLVPVSELMNHLHYLDGNAFRAAMLTHGIHVAAHRRPGDPAGDTYYRAGDIERAFARSPDRLAAFAGEGGKVILKLSEALCVKFEGQFAFTLHFRNYRRPLLITAADVGRALGGGSQESVFDRRGMMTQDAQGCPQRIRMNTHSTRHWKNALYDIGGMSDLQQTWAMHRKDVRQTRVYQHRTIQEQTEVMRRFQDLSHTERVKYLRDAIREGKVAGPVTEAYRLLTLNSPTEAELFLQTYAAGIHVTPWGICANDFTLSPCRKYLQCYDHCRHYHRTGDPEEQRRLEELRSKMKMALDVMRENAAGEAGADKWVRMMEAKLANLEHALILVPHPSQSPSPVPVFPDGVDRSHTATVGKSVI